VRIPDGTGIRRRDFSLTMIDLEGSGLTRADDLIAGHETHHVCQALHARGRSQGNTADQARCCAWNTACSMKMRAHAGPIEPRAYAGAARRQRVMIGLKDRMLDG